MNTVPFRKRSVAVLLLSGLTALFAAAPVSVVRPADDHPPTKEGARVKATLWAGLSAGKPIFEASETERLQLSFALVNDGDRTIDPEIHESDLHVNGKPLEDWRLTVGSGPRDDRYRALPAGKAIQFSYLMGKHFDASGVYRLTWKGKAFQSAELVFRVMPRPRP